MGLDARGHAAVLTSALLLVACSKGHAPPLGDPVGPASGGSAGATAAPRGAGGRGPGGYAVLDGAFTASRGGAGTAGSSGATGSHDGATTRAALDARSVHASVEGSLTTQNASGRSGSFYLPASDGVSALPLLLAYHGTDGSGANMVASFRALAAARRFIIVAPDSRALSDGHYNWEVGDHPGDQTPDYAHALACLDEVRAMPGVLFDAQHVLAAGF